MVCNLGFRVWDLSFGFTAFGLRFQIVDIGLGVYGPQGLGACICDFCDGKSFCGRSSSKVKMSQYSELSFLHDKFHNINLNINKKRQKTTNVIEVFQIRTTNVINVVTMWTHQVIIMLCEQQTLVISIPQGYFTGYRNRNNEWCHKNSFKKFYSCDRVRPCLIVVCFVFSC